MSPDRKSDVLKPLDERANIFYYNNFFIFIISFIVSTTFYISKNCSPDEIRTHTGQILSLLSLPIGLRDQKRVKGRIGSQGNFSHSIQCVPLALTGLSTFSLLFCGTGGVETPSIRLIKKVSTSLG